MKACQKNYQNVVEYLITKGYDTNIANKEGLTALHIATELNYEEIVKYLITYKCNINSQDKRGYTALHIAVLHNNNNLINLLCDSGINKEILENTHGFTALSYLAYRFYAFL